MSGDPTNGASVLALQALAATLQQERLAERFLSLSGIDPPELRQRAGEPALLANLLRFLEAHEPDLLAIAQAIGASPQQLVEARRELER
jgi:hypothetical protein